MRADLTPSDEELEPFMTRFFELFEPRGNDPTYLVLKAHLLFEELLRDFVDKQFANPSSLRGARLTFAQVLAIAQASATTLPPDDWRWQGLKELNKLRNALAHEFDSSVSQDAMCRLVAIVAPNIGGNFPKIEGFPRDDKTEHIPPALLGLVLTGLYAVLCVRLGFDGNMRLLAERERANKIFDSTGKHNAA